MTKERKIKGRIAEASVLKHFVALGYDVFTGYTDNNKHDLIVFDGDQILRVFVRYTSVCTNVSWSVSLANVYRSKTGNVVRTFEADQFDLIAVYIGPEDRVVIVSADIKNKNLLYLPKLDPEPKPRITKNASQLKQPKDTCDCGNLKKITSIRCSKCAPKSRSSGSTYKYKIDWPSDDDLVRMVSTTNYSVAARSLGVSDNAIRGRFKRRGIDPKRKCDILL